MKRKNGFTMIEIMIVIVIIGILAVLGGGAYFQTLRKGRDAKRIEDVKVIQKGFEMYYARNDTYADCVVMGDESTIFTTDLPTQPDGNPYEYSLIGSAGACTAAQYCVCALLERDDMPNSGQYCGYSDADKDYYCASNLQ